MCVSVVSPGVLVSVQQWLSKETENYSFAGSWGVNTPTVADFEWCDVLEQVLGKEWCVLDAQLCPTLCDLMDCSLPGSFVYGALQARILEWVTILFSRGSSQPRD